MTTTTGSAPAAGTSGDPTTVSGDISRLNPADGLFLRAQHLQTIEDYARELALSVGVAAGCGVVWGYRAWLENESTLKVDAGLAIAPDGRPLRSRHTAELDLSNVAVSDDSFWVVEVVPASWEYGVENVYGNLCEDPCSTGAPIRPYQAEGVHVRLREDTMPGLSGIPSARQRNWLASAYFERERERRGPWLLPGAPGAAVVSILGRDWSLPVDVPKSDAPQADGTDSDAVPIAALLRVYGRWVLDVWTARRDLAGQLPKCGWQDRLGMRPWHVFIAQVLQFQTHLAAVFPVHLPYAAVQHPVGDISDVLRQMRENLAKMRIKPRWITEGLSAVEKAIPEASGGAVLSLIDMGIDELPPAGYLPAPAREEDVRSYAERLFGENVTVRVCQCRADYVAHAVEEAQHTDRIPLNPQSQQSRPRVDVLVPSELADLPTLHVASYPWLAFVRRRDCDCGEQPAVRPADDVEVYVIDAGQDYEHVLADIIESKRPAQRFFVGHLLYPPGSYAVPVPVELAREIRASLIDRKRSQWTAIGIAGGEDRQPLAVARAALLSVYFRESDGSSNWPDVRATWDAQEGKEKIVIVLGASRGEPQ
jgi:hypothetical protein